MRAVAVTALGGPGVLRVVEWPDPTAGPGEILVRVRAAAVHPADLAARTGRIPGGPIEPPFLLGWDFAGDVVTVGEGSPDTAPAAGWPEWCPGISPGATSARTPSSWSPGRTGWSPYPTSWTPRRRPRWG
ncbi:alcohol dehydrogenase catalytic domain-containing protein [Plantactinospora veratri]